MWPFLTHSRLYHQPGSAIFRTSAEDCQLVGIVCSQRCIKWGCTGRVVTHAGPFVSRPTTSVVEDDGW